MKNYCVLQMTFRNCSSLIIDQAAFVSAMQSEKVMSKLKFWHGDGHVFWFGSLHREKWLPSRAAPAPSRAASIQIIKISTHRSMRISGIPKNPFLSSTKSSSYSVQLQDCGQQ